MNRKRPDYEICSNCTHTENTHASSNGFCRAYLCDCEAFVKA